MTGFTDWLRGKRARATTPQVTESSLAMRDFGVRHDGVTDDTASVQAAMDAPVAHDPVPLLKADTLIALAEELQREAELLDANVEKLRRAIAQDPQDSVWRFVQAGERQRELARAKRLPRGKGGRFLRISDPAEGSASEQGEAAP